MARHVHSSTALTEPVASIRQYSGEHTAHAHDHAQVLYALHGRMELEVAGRAAFVDTACGMVVPAGVEHGFLAAPGAQLVVIDAPDVGSTGRTRRFSVPAPLRGKQPVLDADASDHLAALLDAPRVLARRDLDLQIVNLQVARSLHEDWNTRRMAALVHLSPQRFHVRWQELTGKTPQQWLRDLRLDAAETALARGESLENTALRWGYRSASALAFALRRDRNIGARDLRKG
ncbi:helix-turn-helix domain-containing protein [Diaphorobacter sp. HDW4A]|nr:helix-turn-helix domain-containing protein [Diaphorobacter sp. HDW4A]QIL84093.1 helix-turn-helix domain-containing protein [Diaphorobacter sp. HDW4A]